MSDVTESRLLARHRGAGTLGSGWRRATFTYPLVTLRLYLDGVDIQGKLLGLTISRSTFRWEELDHMKYARKSVVFVPRNAWNVECRFVATSTADIDDIIGWVSGRGVRTVRVASTWASAWKL